MRNIKRSKGNHTTKFGGEASPRPFYKKSKLNISLGQQKKTLYGPLSWMGLKTHFMAPFHGWGSTASKLEPLRGGSLLFTTKFAEVSGTHFVDRLVPDPFIKNQN